jgi:copper homeostasis protein (lipoprotein)
MRLNVRAAGLCLLAALVAAPAAAQDIAILMGTVTYRERIALPPTAVVEVRLEDVSRANVAPVIASMQIDQPGQVPVRFNLPYDPKTVSPAGRYAARATITDGKNVLFASTDTALVLTQGHGPRVDLVLARVGTVKPQAQEPRAPALPPPPFPELPATFTGYVPCTPNCDPVRYHLNLFADDSFALRMMPAGKGVLPADDLGSWAISSDRRLLVLKGRGDATYLFEIPSAGVLRKLDAEGRPAPGKAPAELRRTSPFRSVDVRGPLRGSFTHVAETGWFVECSTGQRWPVAMEGANRDLEALYAKSRPSLGATVLVEIEGLVRERPRAEGRGAQPTLVVERIVRTVPKESCAPRFASAPLAETYWRLTHLAGTAVLPAADRRRELSLTFSNDGSTFSGSSGCNRVVGTYTVANAVMTMKGGGTMMACRDAAKTEAAFLKTLELTQRYRITGRMLELFDEKGTRLARFEAPLPAGITTR